MSDSTENPPPAFAQSAGYVPEVWEVEKDTIYAAILAISRGMEATRDALTAHDAALGRTTRKNRMWAEELEAQIRQAGETLAKLRECGPAHNNGVTPPNA